MLITKMLIMIKKVDYDEDDDDNDDNNNRTDNVI